MQDPYKKLKDPNTFWEALGPDSLEWNGKTLPQILAAEQEILLALMQAKADEVLGRRIRERAEAYAGGKI